MRKFNVHVPNWSLESVVFSIPFHLSSSDGFNWIEEKKLVLAVSSFLKHLKFCSGKNAK